MEFHPLANVFPLMSAVELAALADDIAAHGQREPIYTWQGSILDGRNRFNACRMANREPWFKDWDGVGDPVHFVLSLNLRRRHLNESQRAMIADKIANLRDGQKRSGAQTCAPGERTASQEEAAELLNVSRRTVQAARTVREQGHEALVAAVEAGEVSINDASKVIRKSKPTQQAAVEAVMSGKAKTAARAAENIEPTKNDLEPISGAAQTGLRPLAHGAPENPERGHGPRLWTTAEELAAIDERLQAIEYLLSGMNSSWDTRHFRDELREVATKISGIKDVVSDIRER